MQCLEEDTRKTIRFYNSLKIFPFKFPSLMQTSNEWEKINEYINDSIPFFVTKSYMILCFKAENSPGLDARGSTKKLQRGCYIDISTSYFMKSVLGIRQY